MSARPATRRGPVPKAPPVPVRAGNPPWAGHLTRHPVSGDLTGAFGEDYILGHQMDLVGHLAAAGRITLLMTVRELGTLFPPAEDDGLSAALYGLRRLAMEWDLTQGADGSWAGAFVGPGWRVAVAAMRDGPGRLVLRGVANGE